MGYKFYQNKECEFFPCHGDNSQNCLFCFCPLYPLMDCGGGYHILDNGVKDCSDCKYPHKEENYGEVMEALTLYCKSLGSEGFFYRKENVDGNDNRR